ncbi:MAG: carboxypeptidase regulatory-like domain-containing protein [Gemmatimonadetes bacterium]|nr:carboxypeptidase regulatory-like domain-containing protein [Gemmatimonadota bacterium]
MSRRRFVCARMMARVALAIALGSESAAAQRVFGAAVLPDGSTPAAFALIFAQDAGNRIVAREMASVRGDFVLPLPGSGTFRIKAQHIGHRPVELRDVVLAPGRDQRLELRFTADATRPAPVTVRSAEQCNIDADTSALGEAWRQFKLALESTRLAAETRMFSALWKRTERVLGRSLIDTVSRSDTEERIDLDAPVMPVLPPDSAALAGYVLETEEGVKYHVPDVTIMLSRQFINRRCFSLEPPPPTQPGWFGIHFRSPTFRIGVSEVEGTIWMDRSTMEPRGLGFRYVNIPPPFDPGQPGGTLRFRRFDTGHWLIDDWTMRVPAGVFRRIFSYDVRGAPNGFATRLTLDGVRIVGARMMELEVNGSTIFRRPP